MLPGVQPDGNLDSFDEIYPCAEPVPKKQLSILSEVGEVGEERGLRAAVSRTLLDSIPRIDLQRLLLSKFLDSAYVFRKDIRCVEVLQTDDIHGLRTVFHLRIAQLQPIHSSYSFYKQHIYSFVRFFPILEKTLI